LTLLIEKLRLVSMVSSRLFSPSFDATAHPIEQEPIAGAVKPALSPLLWGGLLLVPSALIVLAALAGPGTMLHRAAQLAFEPFCHQDQGRSFLLFGNTLVVCVRCTGFYVGIGIVGGAASLAARAGLQWRLPTAAFLLIVPLAVDGTANLLGLWSTGNMLRAVTGVAAATPLAMALLGTRNGTV